MNDLHPSLTAEKSYRRTTVTVDESDHWPPAPTVIRHTLAGELADRVRARFAASGPVFLTETTTYGGTDYTQENATDFVVECGGHRQEFYPTGTADWRQDVGTSWADSVFARFDTWLQVAERPPELFAEWFQFEAEAGQFIQYRSIPGTALTRAAKGHEHHTHHLSLTGAADGAGRVWTLDLVAPADAHGFSRVFTRFHLGHHDGLALTADAARSLLATITDKLMPGKAPL